MSSTAAPLPVRDNLFGICHAVGDALAIDPLYLRVALMLGMLADFGLAVLAYALCGAAVLMAALVERALVHTAKRRGSAA